MSGIAPLAYLPLDPRGSDVAPLDVGAAGRPPVLVDLGAIEPPPASAEEPAPEGAEDEPCAVPPEPGPLVTQAELDQAVAAAAAEAERRVRAEVSEALESSTERRLAEALERCAGELRELHATTLAGHPVESDVQLALAIARAIVPHALERAPLADVEAMLVDLLGGLEPEPRLELKLAPDLVEPGRRMAADVAGRAGFPGELVVDGDPDLEAGDARLVWRHGRAIRRIDRIVAEVEEAVRALCEAGGGAAASREAGPDACRATGGVS